MGDGQDLGDTSSELHLSVDLVVRGGRLDGRLDDGCGQPVSFVGWVGLVSAIDRAARNRQEGRDDARPLRLLEEDGE